MSPAKRADNKGSAPPSIDQTTVTPPDKRYRQVIDQDYSISILMELQSTMGEVKASITSLKSSVDGVKTKVEDLVAWKHKIVGGAVVLGAVLTLLGFGAKMLMDHVSFKPVEETRQSDKQAETGPTKPK